MRRDDRTPRAPTLSILLVLIALILGSTGFALTLRAETGALGMAALLLAALLLVIGLDHLVRQELAEDD